MKNLDKAFMPGYITTSLNGKVIEVVKAEAEKRGVITKQFLELVRNNISITY